MGALSRYQIGVVNGLAYTSYGGDTLPIEVNYYKGSGKLELTGSLGTVMKESVKFAFTIAINLVKLQFRKEFNNKCCHGLHIHTPDGATPKDGPSAGSAFTSQTGCSFSSSLKSETGLDTSPSTLYVFLSLNS